MPRHAEALDQVLELTVLLGEDMTSSLARDSLTGARAHVLWVVGQRGPTTQRDLAEALSVSPRNITGLVDALVATGFVTREPHPSDRRATLVSLTAHGAATTAAMQQGHAELADLLFADLPAGQFDCFAAALGEVLDRLRNRLLLENPEVSHA